MAGSNELTIFIDANTSGLQQGLQEAENKVRNFQDRIQGIADVGQKLAGLGAVMTAGLTVPIIGLATASVKAYGEIQSLQKGLEAVMGSASLASAEFNKLKEVAKLPGLGMQEAVKGSINLQSIGFSAEKSRDILQQFGNAVATVGKGRAEFESAIYGVQQLANTDFPLGEDLNIIKDALPQVSNLLKEAFGSSRSDELANMGVSSKQVLDVILTGLEKLPRVSGGIKGSFENFSDAMQTSLGRIGKVIDDNLNISGLIDKLTNSLDKLISGFEDLSPAMQNTVIVLTGLAGATGPFLLGIGGIMAVVPLVVNGFNAIKTAVEALTASMLRNPYTAIAVALAAIATAVYVYYSSLETGKDRQERFNDSLAKATVQARNEVSELKKLYAVSQDQNKSLDERNKAVDQLQKQYPVHFANLSNEAILVGKAGEAYKSLTQDIYKASRARAAQSILDARNAKRLEEDIKLQEKLVQSVKDYNNAKAIKITSGEVGSLGKIGNVEFTEQEVKASALQRNRALLKERRELPEQRRKKDAYLIKIIEEGQDAIIKTETTGTDNFVKTVTSNNEKVKNAYVYPKGSEGYYEAEISRLEELKKRAQLDSDVWRELSNQIQKYQELLNHTEIEPVKLKNAGFMDAFGNEYKTFIDFMSAENKRLEQVMSSTPKIIDNSLVEIELEKIRLSELKETLNEDFNNLISSSVSNSISETFNSIGESLAQGGNVMQNVGKTILKSLGGFLSKMGQMLIQYGTLAIIKGKLDLATMIGGPTAIATGIAAVAVGAALSLAGGAISSFAGSGGNSNTSSSTGSSASTNYSSSYSNTNTGSGGDVVFRISGPDLIGAINRNVVSADRLNSN